MRFQPVKAGYGETLTSGSIQPVQARKNISKWGLVGYITLATIIQEKIKVIGTMPRPFCDNHYKKA